MDLQASGTFPSKPQPFTSPFPFAPLSLQLRRDPDPSRSQRRWYRADERFSGAEAAVRGRDEQEAERSTPVKGFLSSLREGTTTRAPEHRSGCWLCGPSRAAGRPDCSPPARPSPTAGSQRASPRLSALPDGCKMWFSLCIRRVGGRSASVRAGGLLTRRWEQGRLKASSQGSPPSRAAPPLPLPVTQRAKDLVPLPPCQPAFRKPQRVP